jgi:hypothetical protein
VLQAAADQNAAAVAWLIGIGEIHLLLRQQRAQMFVDLFERSVFESFKDALLGLSFVAFGQNRPVLDDLDTSEFFEDPPFAALYASSASFALRRSYIAVRRSSFSTSARGSSAILSISAKTVEELSNGGTGGGSTGRSLCLARVRVVCFSIRFPPSPIWVQHSAGV